MMRCLKAVLVLLTTAHAGPLVIRSTPVDPNNSQPVDFVVLLPKSEISTASEFNTQAVFNVLAEMDMTVDNPNVLQVYNNSAFQGFAVRADDACQEKMSNMDSISVMEETITFKAQVIERANAVWGLERVSLGTAGGAVRTPTARYQYDTANPGQGADIYIVDTGILAQHQDFGGRVSGGFPDANSAVDTDGHGTHVAGTAAGATFGVASKANLIAVRSLAGGSGSSASVLGGVDFVVRSHAAKKANGQLVASVMSMSLSTPQGQTSQTFSQAVAAAAQAGVHVVVAAGNDGADACTVSPAEIGGSKGPVVSVGAINFNNTIARFSNTGQCVDVYAPGENIQSTWFTSPQATMFLSGTSMATPYVTGIVAYKAASDSALAQDPAAMKTWLKTNGITGVVNGRSLAGDPRIMANNGVTIDDTTRQARTLPAAAQNGAGAGNGTAGRNAQTGTGASNSTNPGAGTGVTTSRAAGTLPTSSRAAVGAPGASTSRAAGAIGTTTSRAVGAIGTTSAAAGAAPAPTTSRAAGVVPEAPAGGAVPTTSRPAAGVVPTTSRAAAGAAPVTTSRAAAGAAPTTSRAAAGAAPTTSRAAAGAGQGQQAANNNPLAGLIPGLGQGQQQGQQAAGANNPLGNIPGVGNIPGLGQGEQQQQGQQRQQGAAGAIPNIPGLNARRRRR